MISARLTHDGGHLLQLPPGARAARDSSLTPRPAGTHAIGDVLRTQVRRVYAACIASRSVLLMISASFTYDLGELY